ncbi:YggT family protein [Falsiroseomonas selenitidurans]|uniref:YggT family protein n=1 Tax=Falsiroseomonas selenitidurans TaxID=2716335 RepID=A0ABX1E7W6_9PROT|nr:YggT family protein [Falsiroseomonas selenitidurans]NKC33006.1 YggT family protein [Falsiroseomonas selenitidurans]
MDQPHFIFGHLPFWLVTYSLAVVGWTLFGRFLMQFFVPPDSRLYIWRFFRLLTDWAVRAAAFLVPRYVAQTWLPLVAAFWIFTFRLAFGITMLAAGLAPRLAPP